MTMHRRAARAARLDDAVRLPRSLVAHRVLVGSRFGRSVAIEQLQRDGVRPSEAVLQRILAAAARGAALHVVLFDELALGGVDGFDAGEEARPDVARQPVLAVAFEA